MSSCCPVIHWRNTEEKLKCNSTTTEHICLQNAGCYLSVGWLGAANSLLVVYDVNGDGGVTKDLNRGICSIEYNCLNLHLLVEFTVI